MKHLKKVVRIQPLIISAASRALYLPEPELSLPPQSPVSTLPLPQFDSPSPTVFRGACAPLNQITSLLCSEPSMAPTIFFFFVQLLSHIRLFVTLWTAAHQASLSFTVSQSFLKLMSIESMIPSNISFSVNHFSSCPQPFPASRSLPMSWLFETHGQSIGESASASVLPVNIQGLFPLGLTGLIYLLFKGLKSIL